MNHARKASLGTLRGKPPVLRRRRYWVLGAAALLGAVGAVTVADSWSAPRAAEEAAPLPPRLASRGETFPAGSFVTAEVVPLSVLPPSARTEPGTASAEDRIALVAAPADDAPLSEAPEPPAKAAQETKPAATPKLRMKLPVFKAPPPPPPAVVPDAASGGPAARETIPPGNPMRIPLTGAPSADRVLLTDSNGFISLVVRNEPLGQVLMFLAQREKLNIVCAENLNTPVSVTLDKVPLETALHSILNVAGCSFVREGDVIYVTSIATKSKIAPAVQGRQVRVFRLDFASASDVEKAVKGLLSPVGQCFTSLSKNSDNRQAHEVVVVEDVLSYLETITQYIDQIDQPPRQVMIEAHVLEVTLDSDDLCGVNLTALFKVLNHDLKFETTGMAVPGAPQAMFFSFNGSDLDFLIQALRTQKNAKTLASPKILVLNGQLAKIHVGEKISYPLVTTTETSTQQSFAQMDVGVSLEVIPRMSRDGQVMINVKPKVDRGAINPTTGGPDTDGTELQSDVLLPDGRGMVIGGLIKETNTESQMKVPFLGDLWLVGKLFRRKDVTKQRQEVIITLIPRVVPACLACGDRHSEEVLQAQTPLFDRNLERVNRPWDGVLPDAVENPAHLKDLPECKQHRAKHGLDGNCPPGTGQGCIEADPYYATAVPEPIADRPPVRR